MPTTPNFGLRYPASTDDVRPYEDIQFLATDVDTALDTLADRAPVSNAVNTLETTTSAAYTDLTSAGPAVTVVTGTSVIVALSAQMRHSTTDVAFMGCAVSGASSISPSDVQAAEVVGTSTISGSLIFKISGLTAGSNTFTAKYRTPSGTATFNARNITVWP